MPKKNKIKKKGIAGNYRRSVASIIIDKNGRLLIGERSNRKGAWQFPQGGIKKKEKKIDALYREIKEETGIKKSAYEVIEKREGYKYRFPRGHKRKGKNRLIGQKQTYYLCRFKGDAKACKKVLKDFPIGEFKNLSWIDKDSFKSKWLPKFKRKAYRKVFRDFFGNNLA